MQGQSQVQTSQQSPSSYTNVPCFDINFRNMFVNELDYLKNGLKEVTDISEDSSFELEAISKTFVDKNLNVVRHYFGLGEFYSSIS